MNIVKVLAVYRLSPRSSSFCSRFCTATPPAATDRICYAGGFGAELWQFRTPELNLNTVSPIFEFAVFYQRLDTGETFWDNNFGMNYRLSKMSGAMVE